MSVVELEQNIFKDIEWRISELSQIKTIPFRYNMTQENKELLIRYSVPSIYALWEGFVVSAFQEYRREINLLKINLNEINIKILTHSFSCHETLMLNQPRINPESQLSFINKILVLFDNKFEIAGSIPTESNVKFKVINKILLGHNLSELEFKYEKGLNKLLKFRNSIAHGDNSIPVSSKDIAEFSNLITELMSEVFIKIVDGYKNKTFLR